MARLKNRTHLHRPPVRLLLVLIARKQIDHRRHRGPKGQAPGPEPEQDRNRRQRRLKKSGIDRLPHPAGKLPGLAGQDPKKHHKNLSRSVHSIIPCRFGPYCRFRPFLRRGPEKKEKDRRDQKDQRDRRSQENLPTNLPHLRADQLRHGDPPLSRHLQPPLPIAVRHANRAVRGHAVFQRRAPAPPRFLPLPRSS